MTDLVALARRALQLAGEKNLSLITAESCTAGKLSALLSEAPGAADRLHGGFVTYIKENKTRALGVPEQLLAEQGAVCPAVAAARRPGSTFRTTTRDPAPTGGTRTASSDCAIAISASASRSREGA